MTNSTTPPGPIPALKSFSLEVRKAAREKAKAMLDKKCPPAPAAAKNSPASPVTLGQLPKGSKLTLVKLNGKTIK
jgi:hypothetical protein